jgi:cellulose biosynthesis protein BcsQ
VLLGEAQAREAIVRCEDGYDLLPGNIDLTAAEIQLMDMPGREQRLLKQALDTVRDGYDFIIDRLPAVAVAAHPQRADRRDSCWCRCSASTTRWKA